MNDEAREAGSQQASGYSLKREGENQRLQDQADFSRDFNYSLTKKAFEGMPNHLLVLDIGCSHGYLTIDLFSRFEQAEKVVGLDRDLEAINIARTRANGTQKRFHFEEMSIEGGEAKEELQELLIREAVEPGAPIVVMMSLVLHHLSNPVDSLKAVCSAIPSGSRVIARTPDDGTFIAYPDKRNRLDRIIAASATGEGASNRFHGRKLFYEMRRAGFSEIEIHLNSMSFAEMSSEERSIFFDIHFSYRRNILAERVAANPKDSQAADDLIELDEMMAAFMTDVQDPDFFLCYTQFGAIATAP